MWRMSSLVMHKDFHDSTNLSAARLRGFEEDLHLNGSQFATVLSILYIGYIILQIPSNMALNYIGRPSLYLPGCMVYTSFEHSWHVLTLLCRLYGE